MLVIINVKHKGLCDDKIIIIIVTGTSEQLKLSGLVFVARGLRHYYIIIYTRKHLLRNLTTWHRVYTLNHT